MKILKFFSAPLLLCAFALSILFSIPSTITAQQNREILRLGRGTANALDWRPDGEVLAVASSTGVWLLDADLNVITHLSDESVTTLAWSPDGEKLATSTIIEQFCALQIWDVDAKRALVESSECADKIVWKLDSQFLAITSPFTQTVSIMNADGDVILKDLPGRAAAWSLDGTQLATINAENLSIWNIASGRKMLTTANQGYGDTLLWTDNGILMLCSEHNPSTYVVSMCRLNARTGVKIDSKVLLWRHPGEWGDLGRLRWNDEKNRFSFIVSVPDGSAPSLAYIFNWNEIGSSIITPASFAAWKPGAAALTIGLDSGLIQNVDATSENVLRQQNVFTAPVRSLVWSPDGEWLASAGSGANQAVHIWDTSDNFETSALTLQPEVVNSLAWTLDSSEILTFGANGVYESDIRAWNIRDGDSVRVIAQDLGPAEGIIAWNSDFTRKATSKGQRITLTGDISIKTARGNIHTIRWSPYSTQIATLSINQDSTNFTIEIWQAEMGERITAIQSGEVSGYDSALYWNNDGTRLAHSLRVAGNDVYTLRIYDSLTGEMTLAYDTPQWYAPKLAWRPDDRVLAVEILTGVIFLDVQSGEMIGEQIPMGYISALAWHPDGDLLAIGGADGVIHLWDVTGLK
jgi:WD40 repeat protein